MKRAVDLSLATAALLVLGVLTLVYSNDLPLGVAGEWEWPRIHEPWPVLGLLIAALGVVAYGEFAALGYRALGDGSASFAREARWVSGLSVSAVAVQVVVVAGAPGIYGPPKWTFIHFLRGSTGYLEIARDQVGPDPWKFLADYPRWIAARESNHIGAHPPGLIAAHAGLLALAQRNPAAARILSDWTPRAVSDGFEHAEMRMRPDRREPIPATERAAALLVSLITLLASAGTMVPLYLLVRESLSARCAWAAAALWPLAPAPVLFQPISDAAYPMLSASALAMAVWSARFLARSAAASSWLAAALAVGSGGVLALGMLFSLAFLPVGLVAALVVLATPALCWARRLGAVAWIGVGFAGGVGIWWLATGANPLVVWSWNLWHNARFNEGSRRSYFPWVWRNPIELAIAAGLPVVVWGLVGAFADVRRVPRVVWSALAVMILVDLSGRNLAEVARLWMIFLPPLFAGVGVGLERLGAGRQAIFVTVVLMGIQTLGLQCMVQFVYPF